jgi:hypothetical protein
LRVKDLLLIVLLVAMVGLLFHDHHQSSDLSKAQTDNAQLSQQLLDAQNQYKQLLARTRSSEVFRDSHPSSSPSQFQLKMDHLDDLGPNPLDRPAY